MASNKSNSLKLALMKALVVAIPSYLVAYLSEKIIFVVPTIAMAMMIANAVEMGSYSNRNRIDDDGSSVDKAGDSFEDADGGGI